jgi:hypothetical protein
MSNNFNFEDRCKAMYNSDQPLSNNNSCTALSIDSDYITDKNIEKRTLRCNIPDVNTTSTIGIYLNLDNNNACPIGGWCPGREKEINEFKFYNDNEITNQITLTKDDQTLVDICPQNIFDNTPSADGTQSVGGTNEKNTLNVPEGCPSLFTYNYTNNSCTLVEKDDEIARKFCLANDDGTVTWTSDENGEMYCSNSNNTYRLSRNVNNNLTCNNGTDIPVVPPVYTIYEVDADGNKKTIECPSGYCLNDNGELNMNYINRYMAQTDKHPFCPDQ